MKLHVHFIDLNMQKYHVRQKLINLRISISTSALELIGTESVRSKYTETGGVIAGSGSVETGEIYISHASLPGPRAKATKFSFQHDRKFCQKFLDDLAAHSKGKIDYLGEWHKHFERNPRPSSTDFNTLLTIAKNDNYHVAQPVLLIIGITNNYDSLKAFVMSKKEKFIKIDWKVRIEQIAAMM